MFCKSRVVSVKTRLDGDLSILDWWSVMEFEEADPGHVVILTALIRTAVD